MKSRSGFTIVELLIVIVVIAILATISIIAYNGIQSRSRTVTAQTELRNFGKIVELYRAEYGSYPTTAQLAAQGGVKINKAIYLAGGNNNWYYCVSGDGLRYAVGATTESTRQGFRLDSVDGLQAITVWGTTTCPGADGTVGLPYTGIPAPSGCSWVNGTCNWQAWIAG